MNKKIYIAGKITGEPVYECIGKFDNAYQYIFWDLFYSDIINPLELPGIHFGIKHEDAMKICLEALKDCTHIYMISDWKNSKGAREEHQFALDNGIEIIYQLNKDYESKRIF